MYSFFAETLKNGHSRRSLSSPWRPVDEVGRLTDVSPAPDKRPTNSHVWLIPLEALGGPPPPRGRFNQRFCDGTLVWRRRPPISGR